MQTIWIMPMILLLNGVSTETKDLRSLRDVINEILITVDIREVQVVVQDSLRKNEAMFNEVYKTISQTLPTYFISFDDSISTELSSSFRTYSNTLLLYVYTAESPPNLSRAYSIIRMIRFLLRTCCPKILFVSSLKETNNDFQPFLTFMWTKKILDMTILDVSRDHEKVIQMTLHQYNPFRKTYTKHSYLEGIEWFPNKVTNLYGYPITLDMVLRTGHNSLTRSSQGYMLKYGGPDGRALRTLRSKLNFTMVLRARKVENINIVSGAMGIHDMRDLESGKTEMIITTVPYDFQSDFDLVGYIYPVSSEKWCPLIPIFYKRNFATFQRLKKTIFSLTVFFTFCAFTRFMRFDRKVWSALKIFGAMLSIPMTRVPLRSTERLAILCLVLISAIYSSDLFANMTTSRLMFETEVTYKSFKDLEKSGLTPVFKRNVYDMTAKYADGELLPLRRKAILIMDMNLCADYLLKHKNISCIMETNMANVMINSNMRDGRPTMKICYDICYWSPPVGYLLHRYSPYINLMSDIMMRCVESGIRDRWYMDYFDNIGRMQKHLVRFTRSNETSVHMFFHSHFFYIILFGYTCGIVTFIVEIVKFRVTRRHA